MKKITKMLCIMLAAVMFVSILPQANVKAAVNEVCLNKSIANITVNQTIKLQVQYAKTNAKKTKVTWKSSNSKVAKVNTKGEVTGLKEGSAEITAKVGKKKLVCYVEVSKSSWIVKTASPASKVQMPKAAKNALEKFVSQQKEYVRLDGVSNTMVAYLGKEEKKGTNYLFLFERHPVIADPTTHCSLYISGVHVAKDGKVTAIKQRNFNLAKYTSSDNYIDHIMAPGTVSKKEFRAKRVKLSKNIEKYYKAATKNLVGVDYRPLAHLGTRYYKNGIVKYAILCNGQTPGSTFVDYYVLTIKVNSKGKATLDHCYAIK